MICVYFYTLSQITFCLACRLKKLEGEGETSGLAPLYKLGNATHKYIPSTYLFVHIQPIIHSNIIGMVALNLVLNKKTKGPITVIQLTLKTAWPASNQIAAGECDVLNSCWGMGSIKQLIGLESIKQPLGKGKYKTAAGEREVLNSCWGKGSIKQLLGKGSIKQLLWSGKYQTAAGERKV